MKINLIALMLFISICTYSCQKESFAPNQVATNSLTDLQYKWILDSVILYQNSNFTGYRFVGYIGDNSQYCNFSTNGKGYSYSGFPPPATYDTVDYKLLPDNYTLLTYSYIGGVRRNTPDTFTVRTLTATSLILAFRNPVNEYGKYAFHR